MDPPWTARPQEDTPFKGDSAQRQQWCAFGSESGVYMSCTDPEKIYT
jgi:hypothetical protein